MTRSNEKSVSVLVKFSLVIVGCFTLTPPLGGIPCEYPEYLCTKHRNVTDDGQKWSS